MTGSSRYSALALLLALSVLTLSACGAESPSLSLTPSLTSGVQGRAMVSGGPVLEGLPPSPWPNAGLEVAVHEGDITGRVLTTLTADSSGAFRVDLPPGRYTLGGAVGSVKPQTVTVRPGKYVKVTLTDNVP